MDMQERVAFEVFAECPDCDDLHLMSVGTATRAEVAVQQAMVPSDAAVEFRIHTLH